MPLTDAAPLVVAQELGLFARHGVRVELSREVGWATIRDKIVYGELDAAHAPAPMLWAAQLGLGSVALPPCSPALVLNLHGNAITLSERLYADGRARCGDAPRRRAFAAAANAAHASASSSLFPRTTCCCAPGCAPAGIDPERDVRIVVVPPAQMFRESHGRTPSMAIARANLGTPSRCSAAPAGARRGAPPWRPATSKKCCMVTQRFADAHGDRTCAAGRRARSKPAPGATTPQNRERLAELLSGARYLNVPARVITPALLGAVRLRSRPR